MDALWGIFEGLRSDDVFSFEGSVEPQVEGVVCHASKRDESATIRAKSPLGPPRFCRTTSSCPHTRSTIVGVRASTPSTKREKHAKMRASARLSVGS